MLKIVLVIVVSSFAWVGEALHVSSHDRETALAFASLNDAVMKRMQLVGQPFRCYNGEEQKKTTTKCKPQNFWMRDAL